MTDRAPTPSFADDRDLLVLRLHLAEGGSGGVEAELRQGPRSLFRTTVDGGGLTLPSDLEGATFTHGEPPVALPPELAEELATALAGSAGAGAGKGEPLWLEFPAPAGLLAVLPWERLLAAVDGCRERPVLRLPYQVLPPRVPPRRGRRVLLCGSSPAAKEEVPLPEALARLAGGLATHLPPGSEVHVFTQAAVFGSLEAWYEDAPPAVRGAVRLHDPRGRDFAVPPRSLSPRGDVPSPWLAWMSDELGTYGADAVHFVAHGYRSGTGGALALSESPVQDRDRRMGRFVWAPELAAFLNQVGAWAVGLTSPRPNFSILGLRLLADRLARGRPGPVLLDEGGTAFGGSEPPWLVAWGAVLADAGAEGLRTAELRFQAHPASLQPRPELAPPTDDSTLLDFDLLDLHQKAQVSSTPADVSEAVDWEKEMALEVEEGEAAEEAEAVEEAEATEAAEEAEEAEAPTPAEAPRWHQAGQRLVEQVWSRRSLAGVDDPLAAARQEGMEEAVDLLRKLMTEGKV